MSLKNLMMWGVIVLLVVGLFQLFQNPKKPIVSGSIPFSSFLKNVEDGRVVQVEIKGDEIQGVLSDGTTFNTYTPNDPNLVEKLTSKGVTITAAPKEDKMPSLLGVLLSWFPMLLLIGVWIFFMRQMQGGRGGAMGFGKSKAKLLSEARGNKVTFNDVAGIDEAKEEVEEIVEFLKDPRKFRRLGGKIPKGALLIGPPGTGKTLLARAVAGEAKVPFYSISGSEFVEMFVGVGASRVRDLFDQAKRNSPCIVFVDEIDAVGRHRGAGLGGGHDEREQTLNQILVEMDGFDTNVNVIVMAATNRPDILDPALLRPGRFDRRVILDNPDIKGRSQILKVHAKGKPISEGVNLDNIARDTHGFSGADLANLINESAILAARRNSVEIDQNDLLESIDRVTMGPERKSRVITDKEKELTAYHEAGHALVGHLLPHSDPITKITIVSRGSAGGYTKSVPDEERHLWTKNQFEDRLAMSLGGRVAEECVFGEITTGASNDLEQATDLARVMVTKYGMSKKLGPRTFGKREELVFLGKEISEQRDYSDKIAEEIDDEVQKLIKLAYKKAEKTIESNSEKLRVVAEYLIKNETIDGDKFNKLIAGT